MTIATAGSRPAFPRGSGTWLAGGYSGRGGARGGPHGGRWRGRFGLGRRQADRDRGRGWCRHDDAGQSPRQIADYGVESGVGRWLADRDEVGSRGSGPAAAGGAQESSRRQSDGEHAGDEGGQNFMLGLRTRGQEPQASQTHNALVAWVYCFGGIFSFMPILSLSGSLPITSLLAS
jgi:hypothetical protein